MCCMVQTLFCLFILLLPSYTCKQKQLSKGYSRHVKSCSAIWLINSQFQDLAIKKKNWRTTCISTILVVVRIHSSLLAGWWGPKLTDFLVIFLPRKSEASCHSALKSMYRSCWVFILWNITCCSWYMFHDTGLHLLQKKHIFLAFTEKLENQQCFIGLKGELHICWGSLHRLFRSTEVLSQAGGLSFSFGCDGWNRFQSTCLNQVLSKLCIQLFPASLNNCLALKCCCLVS